MTLCPHCGWDLQGESDSPVLTCRNCDSAWSFQVKDAQRVAFSVMKINGEDTCCYLSFRRMKVRIEGIGLSSHADPVRLGNLPKAITEKLEEKQLYFWSPAFKINPVHFLRLSRQMTIYQPEGESAAAFPKEAIHPVTVPASEARESIVITLASIVSAKRKLLPLLPAIRIAATNPCSNIIPSLSTTKSLSMPG